MPAATGLPYWKAWISYTAPTPEAEVLNIQDVTVSIGRQLYSDPFRTGTIEIRGRRPDLMPTLSIGDGIRLEFRIPIAGGLYIYNDYSFRITDYVIDYGIRSSLDTWTLTAEDAFGRAGRGAITRTIASGTNTYTAAAAITSDFGWASLTQQGTTTTTSRAVTLTNENGLDALQTMANTEQALITCSSNSGTWWAHTRWTKGGTTVNFGDDGTGLKYDNLRFAGLADLYSQYIINNIVGSTPVATGSGIYAFGFQSYQIDATAAADNNAFLQTLFSLVTQKIYSIGFRINNQDTDILGAVSQTGIERLAVKFRGTTYEGVKLGFRITSTPEETRAEVYLVPLAATNFLTLDDATLGKLNENKLGW